MVISVDRDLVDSVASSVYFRTLAFPTLQLVCIPDAVSTHESRERSISC